MKDKSYVNVNLRIPLPSGVELIRHLLPTPGNIIFTLLVVVSLLWANNVGALPLGRSSSAATTASTNTIAYQGRLADTGGNPLTGTYNMIFRLYNVATGGTPLWEEQWTGSNSARVSDGLFNVMLGSLAQIPQSVVTGNSTLWLGITVGTDNEMSPRVQLGSVPFAVQALTVPDGSITTAKVAAAAITTTQLMDKSVTQVKLGADISLVPPPGSVTTTMIADGAVTTAKLNLLEGNVGIGTSSNPWVKLYASQSMTRSNVAKFDINNADTYRGYNYGFLLQNQNATNGNFFSISNLDTNNATNAEIDFINIDHTTPYGKGALAFITREGYNYERRMYIDEIGNVGIGTTSPVAKLDVAGDFHATGTKSAVVQAGNFGQRALYAAESPEVRFFDEGLAYLKDGLAQVDLDPVFLETIEGDYLVHVTPYGNASLYVSEIGKGYFAVKARDGDPNVAFAWRLSAHRRGYASVRLAEVNSGQ